jgi:hypothetical protein
MPDPSPPADQTSVSPAEPEKQADQHPGFRFAKFLCTQNPFYLLSVCFVLHGTSLWMNGSHEEYEALPLFLLICGYIFMMSLTAVTVIRKAKLWEDARSILLLVPLLLVVLSLTLDDPLITDPFTGGIMVVCAFLFSAGVMEMLLRGLRIRLPWLYRLPLHALMGLIVVYPLAIVPALHYEDAALSASWRIYLFSPLSALVVLSLIPAIRKGADYVRENGTPWNWPLYPWTVFTFLIFAVGARGYSYSLSFDPVLDQSYKDAMGLEAAWGMYFLTPLLLAVAFLLLEFGIVTRRISVSFPAMILPAAACGLILFEWNDSLPYRLFQQEFTTTIASPLFIGLCCATLFYFVALRRGVPLALPAFTITLLGFTVVGPKTVDPLTVTEFQPLPLLLAGSVLLTRGLFDRRSGRFFLGLAGITLWIGVEFWPYWSSFTLLMSFTHLLLASCLLSGVCFRDNLSRDFLFLGMIGLCLAAFLALFHPPELPNWLPDWSRPVYVLGLIATALMIAYPCRLPPFFYVALTMLLGTTIESGRLLLELLQSLVDWRGLSSFLIGFAILLLGILVSAGKAGFLERLKALVPKPTE